MTILQVLAVSFSWVALVPPLLCAGDLSRYRDFQIGSDLRTIATQTDLNPAQAKLIHRRPALIQELVWRPQPLGPSTQAEAANEVIFSFYNDRLYRIFVNYDGYKTEGLTAEDFVEAISAVHGTATRAAMEIILPSIYGDETLQVLARWENAEYAFNLVRFPYQSSFTLVAFSKRLDALARAAAVEAIRLDAQEAPQREIELQKKQQEEKRVQQEKARLVNKPSFRP